MIYMPKWNTELLQYLNSFTENEFIASFVSIFADLPIFLLPIFLLTFWIIHTHKRKNDEKRVELMYILYGTVIAIFISIIIQQFVNIDRPESALTSAKALILDHIPDASFPSDHASVSIAFLTGVFLSSYRKYFWIFLPLILIMNLSRVMVGVHWPLDILAGTIVGITGGYIALKQLPKIKFVKSFNASIMKLLSYIRL